MELKLVLLEFNFLLNFAFGYVIRISIFSLNAFPKKASYQNPAN